jgi:hypothetical protein
VTGRRKDSRSVPCYLAGNAGSCLSMLPARLWQELRFRANLVGGRQYRSEDKIKTISPTMPSDREAIAKWQGHQRLAERPGGRGKVDPLKAMR